MSDVGLRAKTNPDYTADLRAQVSIVTPPCFSRRFFPCVQFSGLIPGSFNHRAVRIGTSAYPWLLGASGLPRQSHRLHHDEPCKTSFTEQYPQLYESQWPSARSEICAEVVRVVASENRTTRGL